MRSLGPAVRLAVSSSHLLALLRVRSRREFRFVNCARRLQAVADGSATDLGELIWELPYGCSVISDS
eukprot:scaffold20005_cov52-Phaeocystis_antarctica.AAC.3